MTQSVDAPLTGLTVLVVEDQPLIAMDIEDMLSSLGAAAIIVASTADEARLALGRSPGLDLAVLDFVLGNGETTEEVADELATNGVPVVCVSGMESRDRMGGVPSPLQDAVFVEKPIDPALLREAVVQALHARSRG